MADTYSIDKIKVTIDSTVYEVDTTGGAVEYDVPVAKYDKAVTITTVTGKKNGTATTSFTNSFVDKDGHAVTAKVPIPDGVFILVKDGATEVAKVRVTTEFLLKIIQEKYYVKMWIGVGDAPDTFFDPEAKMQDGTPVKVTPKLGWFYIDASTGELWIYDGSAWNDTGEKWTGGFL